MSIKTPLFLVSFLLMKITDKLLLEDKNTDAIYLHSDGGVFIRAYDKSAFALERLTGRKLQINIKYNRKLKRKYVFVGFPVNTLSGFIFRSIKEKRAYFTIEPEDESHIVYIVRKDDFTISEEMYLKWFSSHINKILMRDGRKENSNNEQEKESKKPETQEGGRGVFPSSVHVNIYLHEGMHVQVQKD